MDRDSIEMLFRDVDIDQKGYLTLSEFEQIGLNFNLSQSDIESIFSFLDANKDGRIEESEFLQSFHKFMQGRSHADSESDSNLKTDVFDGFENGSPKTLGSNNINGSFQELNGLQQELPKEKTSTPKTSSFRKILGKRGGKRKLKKKSSTKEDLKIDGTEAQLQKAWDDFVKKNDSAIYTLNNYEGICQLYKETFASGNTNLVRHYESVIRTMVSELIELQKGVENLEDSLAKETEKSKHQLSVLEEEMECQIASKEEKARDEERRLAEENESKIKDQYDEEIQRLQHSIDKLKLVDKKLSIPSPYEREVEALKQKLNEVSQENSNLKMTLTEAETNMKVLQSQMVEMKVENEEKILEYQRNEDAVSLVLNEKDSISKQVESLSTNNRRLIDSNDGLREALEAACRDRTRQHRRSNGSVLQNDANHTRYREYAGSGRSSQASTELEALAQCDPGMQLRIEHDVDLALNGYAATNVKTAKDILNSISDSGVGTVLDDQYDSDEWDSNGFLKRHHGRSQSARASIRKRGVKMNASFRSDRPYKYNPGEDTPHGSISPRSDEENLPLGLSSSQVLENGLRMSKQSYQSSTSSLQRKVLTPDITLGHNDRIYKVVLCGDAGVGKSSFIYRLCKNKFKRHTTSTLGVDFQMKTVQLEHDESVSLQLWDTAGQERFRSISASYFRRAQGALLLYDCTIPSSFINIRDWMETISTEIPIGAPIMIIGNKIDLREQYMVAQRHVVSSKEGAQLAASYGVLFMETSAADGQNISTAITMLARHLNVKDSNNNEDKAIKTLTINDEPQTKSKCCQQG